MEAAAIFMAWRCPPPSSLCAEAVALSGRGDISPWQSLLPDQSHISHPVGDDARSSRLCPGMLVVQGNRALQCWGCGGMSEGQGWNCLCGTAWASVTLMFPLKNEETTLKN